jgi:phosphatidylserine/phosphatidylglycerophosphate/cardiolipin synthase-like enzyme
VIVSSRLASKEVNPLDAKPLVLKVLLQHRHLQTYRAFCREYDKVAAVVDPTLRGGWPSKAQFYRWLSGDLVGLPFPDHCRILEGMFSHWKVDQLFQFHDGGIEFVPEPTAVAPSVQPTPPTGSCDQRVDQVVAFYPHRADTPKHLWMDLLVGSQENIDLFANASLFLPEENPEAIEILKEKAASGVKVRILLGDPDHPAMELRGREERLFEAIPGRIKMALAYYRPLVDVEGIEFRLHGTSLYNSIFRYDNQMLVNQHIYGTYGYIAPILHLRRVASADLFDTYIKSLELVWREESYNIHAEGVTLTN